MKELLISFFIVLTLWSTSFAKLSFIPLDEAIKNNDLIIVGTLKDISENEVNGVITGKGKILVERFIAGNVKTIDGKLLKSSEELELNYIESFPCIMGSHKYIENKKGVFLLKLDDQGKIEYEDFRLLENLSDIKKFLKKGIKLQQEEKFIKTFDDAQKVINLKSNIEESGPTFYCSHSTEVEERNSLIFAFLTILTSISLYYFLYRSKFKIR